MNRKSGTISTVAGILLGIGVLILIIFSAAGGWDLARKEWNETGVVEYNDVENIQKSFDGEIQSLDIDISYGSVTIETGEGFSLDAEDVIKDSFKVMEVKDGVLTIKQKTQRIGNGFNLFRLDIDSGVSFNVRSKITITVPEDFAAEKLSLSTGVGNVIIDGIRAQKASLELGTGDTEVSGFTANEAIISTGTGNLDMKDVQIRDMDMESGVGNTTVQGVVEGTSVLERGVGNLTLNLAGNIDEYTFEIDNGVGKVRINGEKWDGRFSDDAANSFTVDSGVGNVDINIEPAKEF